MSWDYFKYDYLYPVVGMDGSTWQRAGNDPIDFDLLMSRIGFSYWRILWRQYEDSDFSYYHAELKNRYPDHPTAWYQYFTPRASNTNMKKQFEAMQKAVNDYGMPAMGIMFDIEENPDNLSKQQFGDAIAKYYAWAFAEWGQENIWTYTSTKVWGQYLGENAPYKTDYPKKTKLAVARYHTGVPTPDYAYALPADWADLNHPPYGEKWLIWQFSADGNRLGNGLTPGYPSFGVHSYDIDLNRFNGDAEDFKKLFGVYPSPITNPLAKDGEPEPPPPPPVEVKRVKIKGLLGSEQLNMRSAPWGTINAKTFNGAQFDIMSTVKDVNDREWYQVGQNIYIASWYTEAV